MKQNQPQDRERSAWLKTLLLGLAVWCIALTAADGIRCLRAMRSLQGATAEGLVARARQETDLQSMLAPDRDMAEAIKKKNFYVPPPPKRNPVTEVTAIVGKEAFINGQWHKAGDHIGDAVLLDLCPAYVTVEWDGQKKQFSPLGAPDSGGPNGPAQAGPPSARPAPPGAIAAGPVEMSGPPPGMIQPSPEEIERLKTMSPEEQKAFVEAHMQR